MIDLSILFRSVDRNSIRYCELSDRIWEHPETAFEEAYASQQLILLLRKEGFLIKKRKSNHLKNAFIAEFGSGKPIIALLGEYDALPGLSQAATLSSRQEIVPGGAGHGCGHHLLGVGAAAAAIAVKDYLKQHDLSGTIRFYGCPAEESGGGKAHMLKAGMFHDVDACFTWHPSTETYVVAQPYLANISMSFDFHGKASHAAAAPEHGRSALDACELMNVGANYLREHVSPDTHFHYAYTNTGGSSPNTIPETAGLLYYIRASKISEARNAAKRIQNIAKGAAMMTETEVSCRLQHEVYDYIPNHTLGQFLHTTLPLSCQAQPYARSSVPLSVSSDVGNVSHLIPTAQLYSRCYAKDTPFHSWQMVAQGKSDTAHAGMLNAAKMLAVGIAKLFEEPSTLIAAKEEFVNTTK